MKWNWTENKFFLCRGYGTKKESPFRQCYQNLHEFICLLDHNTRYAVFTATATPVTKNRIFQTLGLNRFNTFCLEKSPLKDNIKFSVTNIGNDTSIENLFELLINEISVKKEHAKRILIYCQSRTQCAIIWQTFAASLGSKLYMGGTRDLKKRLVEMFHAGTPSEVKEHIMINATNADSCLRIIICTIAFGMGINCRGFNTVIHFGPSKDIELYVQECGRAGRDGTQSICYLLCNSLLSSRTSDDMKEYLLSNECKRETIGKLFSSASKRSFCPCCDICVKECECDVNRSCQELLTFQKKVKLPVVKKKDW